MFTNENYLKCIAYLLYAGGTLFVFIGGLIAYIFKEHVEDNHLQFTRNREDHKEIFEVLRGKKDK